MPAYNHTRDDSPLTPCPLCRIELAATGQRPAPPAERPFCERPLTDGSHCPRCMPCPLHSPMTLDELLHWALFVFNQSMYAHVDDSTLRVAVSVVDMLGESFPCGFEEPRAEGPDVIAGNLKLDATNDAPGYIAAMLRAAEEGKRNAT